MSEPIQTYRTLEDGYLIRIPIDTPIIKTVHQFAMDHTIPSATVSAIGAVKDVELGYYRLADKTYIRKQFPEITELVSFSGNLSWIDDKPFLHAHASLSDSSFNMVGGH
ncbi:MAG: PPC domain-containing DNA-binding protein, partial [Calditrichota bacterium]